MDSEKKHTNSPFARNVFIGSIAGLTEATTNQWTVFAKNFFQQQQGLSRQEALTNFTQLLKKNPRILMSGYPISAGCMIPATAAQIGISEQLKKILPEEDIYSRLSRNGLAGSLSGALVSPIELAVIYLQNYNAKQEKSGGKKIDTLQAVKNLYKENGPGVIVRGSIPKIGRDLIFTSGLLTFYEMAEQEIKEHIGNTFFATILTALVVGVPTATASHVFDTLSTRMQADHSKHIIKSHIGGIQLIYTEGGLPAFFKGYIPRTTRVIFAIPLIIYVKEWLSKKL